MKQKQKVPPPSAGMQQPMRRVKFLYHNLKSKLRSVARVTASSVFIKEEAFHNWRSLSVAFYNFEC